jgi:uncharacterized OB-fold protein
MKSKRNLRTFTPKDREIFIIEALGNCRKCGIETAAIEMVAECCSCGYRWKMESVWLRNSEVIMTYTEK